MIRVLLADDQAMFRRALPSYSEITTDFEVVAEASNADQALRLIHHHQPDVALRDIQMPGDGLTVAEEVARCGVKTQLIICTTFDRPGYVLQAWERPGRDLAPRPSNGPGNVVGSETIAVYLLVAHSMKHHDTQTSVSSHLCGHRDTTSSNHHLYLSG